MRHVLVPAAAALALAAVASAPLLARERVPDRTTEPSHGTTYEVTHTLDVGELPEGAHHVRLWFWMPEDRPGQRVLDFDIAEAPEGTRITRDPAYGRSWVHADFETDGGATPRIETKFRLRRSVLAGLADASRAGPITDAHRRTFARELRLDERHMEVTPQMRRIADELCGDETNPVVQARRIFDYVIEKSEHYSKLGGGPQGLCLGDASECLAGTGDCCTDQHALFIALARARGIPCRLVFGSRLQPQNADKEHDPGYRCWPLFFAPGLGWVPLDISAADAAPEQPERWFGGLDDRRVEWAEGRDFQLAPASDVRPDLVIRAWVEVDGKQYTGFHRSLLFREVPAGR